MALHLFQDNKGPLDQCTHPRCGKWNHIAKFPRRYMYKGAKGAREIVPVPYCPECLSKHQVPFQAVPQHVLAQKGLV